MNKLRTAVLVFVIVILAAVTVYAAPDFSIGGVGSVQRGQTIRVPINVGSNNPGFTAAALEIGYDPNVLIPVRVEAANSNALSVPNGNDVSGSASGQLGFMLYNSNLEDFRGSGTVAYAVFTVRDNAPEGSRGLTLRFTRDANGNEMGRPTNSQEQLLNSATAAGNTSAFTVSGGGPAPTPTPTPIPAPVPYAPYVVPTTPGVGTSSIPSGSYTSDYDSGDIPLDWDYFPDDDTTDFIGTPYIPPTTTPDPVVTPTPPASFGRVPQTGLPDITGYIALLCVSAAVSACMWAYLLRRQLMLRKCAEVTINHSAAQ